MTVGKVDQYRVSLPNVVDRNAQLVVRVTECARRKLDQTKRQYANQRQRPPDAASVAACGGQGTERQQAKLRAAEVGHIYACPLDCRCDLGNLGYQ